MKRSLIIVFVAAVLLLGTLLISGYVVQERREDLIETTRKEATLKTIHSARLISEFIRERLKIMDSISTWMNPLWKTSPAVFKTEIIVNIRRLLKKYPGFESIHYLDPRGIVVWSVPEEHSLEGVNFSRDVSQPNRYIRLFEESRLSKQAKVAPLRVTYFNPFKGKLDKTEYLIIAAPVFRSETYLGVLLAVLRVDDLGRKFFPHPTSSEQEDWMLVNGNGEILFANTALASPLWKEVLALIKVYRAKWNATQECHSKIISLREKGKKDGKVLISCSNLSIDFPEHWHVVRIQSLGFVEADMRRWLLQTRVIAGLAIAVMVLAAIFLIVSLQRSEEKLDFLNKKYRDLLDSLQVGTFSFGRTGQIDYVNRRACEILGYSREELIGKDRLFFAWNKEREEIEKVSRLRMEGKRGAETYRTHMVQKTGRLIDVEIYASPVTGPDGEVQSVRVMFTDITRQVEMEREIQAHTRRLEKLVELRTHALQESEALYRSIFETTLAIIYIHKDSRFKIMNKTGMAFFGFETREEMLRANVWDTVPKGERERQMENAKRWMRGEHVPTQYESLVINKDGEVRVVACHFQRIQYRDEQAILAILFDVTERKRLEAEVAHADKLKSMGQLATGIAHDFNNILAAILGWIQLLERQPNNPRMVFSCTRQIRQAVEQGVDTVKRIQEYTRVRSGGSLDQLLPLHKILEDAVEITRYAWKDQAQKCGIMIRVEKMLKDKNRLFSAELREVFMNIILNAVDAMAQGGTLRIRTEPIELETGKEGVRVAFEDNGSGIPPEVLDHVFKPFYSTKGTKGSGLGLSIVSEVVERLGGTVALESMLGVGTTVTIDLPWKPAQQDQKVEERLNRLRGEKRESSILVVDDEAALPEIFKELLTPQGYDVVIASSGEEACSIFLENPRRFALVFTDLGMPRMNGWELAEKIREIDAHIPIVLVTGWGLEISEEDIKNARVTEMLTKPVTLEQINRIVAHFLGRP